MTDFTALASDPVAFCDRYISVNERGEPFRLVDHQREILRAAFVFDAAGRLGWDTFIYSCPKKSGKTTINAALTTWWLFTQEAPNEVYVLANDEAQALARTFSTMGRLIRRNAALAGSVEVFDKARIVLSNESEARALACDSSGEAGANPGLSSWDELWGYVSEAAMRLWEEFTPVPTRRNSIRIVTTYAGHEDEGGLLRPLYLQGVGPEEHPDGQGARIHETLPLYLNREARLLVYWDHEARMEWQTASYRQGQRRALREATYDRLHENRWRVSATVFITDQLWDSCIDLDHHPLLPTQDVELFVGVDASTKHDSTAVVAVYREEDWLTVACHRIWLPGGEPLDLEETVERHLRALCLGFRVAAIVCDPFQFHRSITTLAKDGLPITEFPQTGRNVTRMGQILFDLLKGMNLRVYPSDELRAQALHTVAIESSRGFRIAKEKATKKIDAIVALSLACVACLDTPVSEPLRVW